MLLEARQKLGELFSPDRKLEQLARPPLQEFLDEHYKLIKMMRVLMQCAEGIVQLEPSDFEALRSEIEKNSPEGFSWYGVSLCEIGEYYVEFQHESSALASKVRDNPPFIRGFYFPFKHNGTQYKCVDLDGGASRSYFDNKDESQKRKFIEQFSYHSIAGSLDIHPSDAYRFLDKKRSPIGYTVFLSDTGESFTIDFIATRWPLRNDVLK